MVTTFKTTELDFNNIKTKLKTFLSNKSEFADYDFEASGLNNILDVLAYNTHYNMLGANFALNEAYLTSAQLRSSVTSIAQSLGYKIRSRSASVAYVNLSLDLTGAGSFPTSITLPIGTKFSSSVDGVSYTFQTRATYTAVNNSGVYDFVTSAGSKDIPIYEGSVKTKTFIVQDNSERQIFVIPDTTIDTTQVIVKVYDSYNSTSFVSYTDISGVSEISTTSTFYRIVEVPNGCYELNFGDGVVTGVKPSVGNKVVIEYLSTVGPAANTAKTFTPLSQVTVNSVNYTLSTVLKSVSSGGNLRQSIESIRQNAPMTFASQNRLVTADDYKTLILSKYSSVSDIAVWGGEDNVPKNYGVVYASLLFDTGIPTASQDAVKDSITNVLNANFAVLSIDINFVDPIITYLEITTNFAFNPDKTSLTKSAIETQIRSTVETHIETNLNTFSGIFRKSNLVTELDDVSTSVLSSDISVKLQQRLTPVSPAQAYAYDIYFPAKLAQPDDVNYVITSSTFDQDGTTGSIKNKLSSTVLQIVDANGVVLVDNVGSYDPNLGYVSLIGFNPGSILSGDTFIKITAVPLNDNTIKPLRNYYFDIDKGISTVIANTDREDTQVLL